VFGVDRPEFIAAVTQVLAEAQCSIIDINQDCRAKEICDVLIADMSQSRESAASLKEKFRLEGDRLGCVFMRSAKIFSMRCTGFKQTILSTPIIEDANLLIRTFRGQENNKS